MAGQSTSTLQQTVSLFQRLYPEIAAASLWLLIVSDHLFAEETRWQTVGPITALVVLGYLAFRYWKWRSDTRIAISKIVGERRKLGQSIDTAKKISSEED